MSEQTSRGQCNAWFAAAIRTNLLGAILNDEPRKFSPCCQKQCQNRPLGGPRNAWFAAAIRTNLSRVTATHGSRRPSEQTLWGSFKKIRLTSSCFLASEAMSEQTSRGSLQRMVRCGHQNKPVGGRCNAWFAAAIWANFRGPFQNDTGLRPCDEPHFARTNF